MPRRRYDDWQTTNALFTALPARYRRYINSSRTDATLPNTDCSAGCFEGIRSEELLGVLDRWFNRREVYLRIVFLWRLVDYAYVDNYPLASPDVSPVTAVWAWWSK
ncbi:MAG: hypothetical protein LW835_18000 [Burkholderiaceae bacterium]|nr:hypothetical protein [Burkholderiaceae bacterium]